MDAVYLGDGVIMTRLVSGRLMYVLGKDRSLMPSLVGIGSWEHHITHLLTTLLRPGMSFLDVGANFGYFSLLAADMVGPAGSVIAVEANPRLADLATNSLQINGFGRYSSVHNVAIDEQKGRVELRVLSTLLGSSSFTMTREFAESWNSDLETVTVPAATLDEVVDGRRIDVMKIDIEGAELRAFRGAEGLLRNNPGMKVIMEFAPGLLGGAEKAKALIELLTSYGLKPFVIHSHGQVTPFSAREAAELPPSQHADLLLKAA